MNKYNPLDGDRAAITYNNKLEDIASKKRWDAYHKGKKDRKNHKAYFPNYTNKDEIAMYRIGWYSIKRKK